MRQLKNLNFFQYMVSAENDGSRSRGGEADRVLMIRKLFLARMERMLVR
jgi:hypothetical protein